jgi:uncharacterized protein (UPF0332 family)
MVRPHPPSRTEIALHLSVADRDLRDAEVPELSDDGKFRMAYSAAYQLSTIALFASGYEAHGEDHHKTTFSALPVAMGVQATMLSDYLERCRRKRNNIQYDQVNVASKSEADELALKTKAFRADLLKWLAQTHPHLLPEPLPPVPS